VGSKFVSIVIFYISTNAEQLTIRFRIVNNEGKNTTEINVVLHYDKGLKKAEKPKTYSL